MGFILTFSYRYISFWLPKGLLHDCSSVPEGTFSAHECSHKTIGLRQQRTNMIQVTG